MRQLAKKPKILKNKINILWMVLRSERRFFHSLHTSDALYTRRGRFTVDGVSYEYYKQHYVRHHPRVDYIHISRSPESERRFEIYLKAKEVLQLESRLIALTQSKD